MSVFINNNEISSNEYIDYPEGKDYKTYRGFRYHLNFPDEWILDEKEDTGRTCTNCVGKACPITGLPDMTGFAMWRGIILGYCANCAEYHYDYERGQGFYKHGVEIQDNEYNVNLNERGQGFYEHGVEIQDNEDNVKVSAFDMYLGEIDFEALGDLEVNPENTLENQEKTKEEVNDMYYDNHYRRDDISEEYENEEEEEMMEIC